MIPVPPIPVVPGWVHYGSGYPGAAFPGSAFPTRGARPEQRASDADRDTAVEILCAAVADGRLTLAELAMLIGRPARPAPGPDRGYPSRCTGCRTG
jgi:Domain of unknown function (DUF1707)